MARLLAMIWSRSGGRHDGPLLVLLHGLGATAEVWRGVERLLPKAWPGGWLAVDLAGHGRSPWTGSYSFADHAESVCGLLPTDRVVVFLGHSMGGMVALPAAARLRPDQVVRVVGFSIKSYWPEQHVAGMKDLAARAPTLFDSREAAVQRYLKVSGLQGLVPVDDAVDAGIQERDGGWRIAQDPATNDFGVPDMPALLAAVSCPVTLARGSEDPYIRAENLAAVVPDPVTFAGLGHNPHVEDPASVVGLL